MADDKGIQKPDEPTPDAPNPDAPKPDATDLGQFKTPEDMLKGYKEIQGAFTRTTQELKELKEANAKLKEDADMAQYAAPQNYQQTQVQTEDFDSLLAEDPRKAIETVNTATYKQMRIAETLEELQEENKAAFQGRYNHAQMLSQNPQYAHLAGSAVGVRKLFKLGDELMEQETKKNASQALEAILGGPVDDQKIAKLREVLGTGTQQKQKQSTQLSDVYMPDTSDTYRPGPETQVDKSKEFDDKTRKAVKEGDIDGVIEAAFGKALAE